MICSKCEVVIPPTQMAFTHTSWVAGKVCAQCYVALNAVDTPFSGFMNKKARTVVPTPVTAALSAKEGFTFGCDPEFFIKNEEGKHVSAEGLIPGSKDEPYKVDRGAVQVDGMAAEFNIDPVSNFDDWNLNILSVIKSLKEMLPEGYKIDIIPSVTFDEDVFNKAADKAKELGCTPDLDAWTGSMNSPPNTTDTPFLRCAGGHIHIGWTSGVDASDIQHVMNGRDLVKQLDWYLGAWSLTKDKDDQRRLLYGKAGACRIKDYGVEYRTLSNFWIKSKQLRLEVWNRMVRAVEDMSKMYVPDRLPRNYNNLLISSINTSKLAPAIQQLGFPITHLDNRVRNF